MSAGHCLWQPLRVSGKPSRVFNPFSSTFDLQDPAFVFLPYNEPPGWVGGYLVRCPVLAGIRLRPEHLVITGSYLSISSLDFALVSGDKRHIRLLAGDKRSLRHR